MDTIREQNIKAVQTRVKPLSTLPIERAQRSVNESNARFVSLWDGEDQSVNVDYTGQTLQFPLAVECVWKAGNANPSVSANALIGEVVKTVMTGSKTLGGLSNSIEYVSATPTYPDDGSKHTSLVVTFLINYTTVKGDPFTSP